MIKSPGVGEYLCGHYLLEAHAAAYHLYKEKYFKKYHGEVGIVLDSRYFYPNDSSVDKHDVHRAQEYRVRSIVMKNCLTFDDLYLTSSLVGLLIQYLVLKVDTQK